MKRPKLRTQGSIWDDEQFEGIKCTPEEDMARQEYKLQADLSYQVQRFGAGLPFQAGEWDAELDLTKAYSLLEESKQQWLSVPKKIRDRYQSWANVEVAIKSGELEQFMRAAGIDGGSIPSKPAAPASDSAPVQGEKPV